MQVHFGLEISIPRLSLLMRATMAMITGMARPTLGMASGIPFTKINDQYQKNGEEEGETVLLSERQ